MRKLETIAFMDASDDDYESDREEPTFDELG